NPHLRSLYGLARARSVRLGSEVTLEEHDRQLHEEIAVLSPPKTVSLVAGQHVPDLLSGFANGLDELLSLAARHARIVGAVGDEECASDGAGPAKRRDRLEMRAHLRIPLVAVLGAAQVLAIATGVGQEGDEVGNADDVDTRPQALAEV